MAELGRLQVEGSGYSQMIKVDVAWLLHNYQIQILTDQIILLHASHLSTRDIQVGGGLCRCCDRKHSGATALLCMESGHTLAMAGHCGDISSDPDLGQRIDLLGVKNRRGV